MAAHGTPESRAASANERHGVADRDHPFLQDVRVQREPSAEAAADVPEHFGIAHQSVGIDRRHRTAAAQRIEADDRAADVQLGARPLALVEAVDAANHDVRTQTADVASKRRHGAIGGDQQREDVEPIEHVRRFEPRVLARGRFDARERLRAVPGQPVDERLAMGTRGGMESEEPMMNPRRAHTLRAPDPDRAVAGNAVESHRRVGETLARE